MSEQNEAVENHDIHDNKQEIDILMNHVKQLEEENNQLYENILKMGNKKQKKSLEYYVRLKKDLLTEENKLNQELIDLEKNKEKEKKELSFKLYNLKKKLNETLSENKTLKSLIESTNNELNKKTTTLSKRNVVLKNEINEKHIDELETKVNDLASKLREKESIIQEQKDKIDDLQMKIDNNFENMTAQINDIKLQYNNVYSASKKNEYNFNKLYEDKTNNLKDDIQSNKYQLEKKLVHSKNLISNINKENVILNNIYESDSQIKDNEINNLKNNLDKVNNIYLEFSKLCGGDLEKLKNNIKQMKEIYLDRENEMETISKIYVETMNNYGEAIQENEKNKDAITSDFSENELLIHRLNDKKKDLELILNKLKNIKLESVGDNISHLNSILNEMTSIYWFWKNAKLPEYVGFSHYRRTFKQSDFEDY
jgi:myosin heavy subunit